jgi:hypothetical protein
MWVLQQIWKFYCWSFTSILSPHLTGSLSSQTAHVAREQKTKQIEWHLHLVGLARPIRNSSGTEIYLVAAAQGVLNWFFEPRFSLSSPDGFTVFTNNTM